MPLVTPEELGARRSQVAQSSVLTRLADRLGTLARPVDRGDVYLPDQKALLSRDGGVCARDGSRLVFDPLRPNHHRCPRCNLVHQGERHHRAWIWRYHLWLSERAIHLALLGGLTGNLRYAARAREILDCYAGRYRSYPNSDNVLGPTRLFFSTYLESIWLIQIVTAAWLLNGARPGAAGGSWANVDNMVRESVALVGSFNETWSNRQVWNNTALIAAGRWLGDDSLVANGFDARFGVRAQLTSGVSEEGLWYEGENYHFFALRGFALAAAFLRSMGIDLYGDDGPRGVLTEMFAAPLKTLLPDLTLPARADSPYGVSLLQPRFAELWELGWARTHDERLGGILCELYDTDAPEGEDTGFSELAEQEQNRRPQKLSRDRLGWKALLCMSVEPPHGGDNAWRRASRLLPNTGLAVLRTTPERYVSLECGGDMERGGHGHPDLLHLTVVWGRPVLADFGTGSYVSPSLHWYRSPLAHNAPASVAAGQVERLGACVAIDSDADWAWCRVVADDLFGDGTEAVRSVVVGPTYVVDIVEVRADSSTEIELPIHPVDGVDIELDGARAVTQFAGYGVPSEVFRPAREVTSSGGMSFANKWFKMHLAPRPDERVLLVEAPGPPSPDFADGLPTPFVLRRASGSGQWVQCYTSVSVPVERIEIKGGDVFVVYEDASRDRIRVRPRACSIAVAGGDTRRMSGARARPPEKPRTVPRPRRIWCPVLERIPTAATWRDVVPSAAVMELGPGHYRRSETPHGARGRFDALVAVATHGSDFWFIVDVAKPSLAFRSASAPDPRLDNEMPDIHSDGVQCYIDWRGWTGFVLVPDPTSHRVRITPVDGARGDPTTIEADWCRTERGYTLVSRVALDRVLEPGETVFVNVVVNEYYADRQRRSGQLALSGGGWVYLRGDREDPRSALLAVVQ